jgi:chromosome segregation and condensation protein ScpB
LTENEQKSSDTIKQKANKQLALMEAALYVTGRPLDMKTMASVVGTRSKKRVRKIAKKLVDD